MTFFNDFFKYFSNKRLSKHFDEFEKDFKEALNHGDLQKWINAIENMPKIKPSVVNLNSDAVKIGSEYNISNEERISLKDELMKFHPWRKGPYSLFGVDINTEWRSDLKWNRLKDEIGSLKGRKVLDVGSGNGYHCWRMLGKDARFVVGIDPLILNVFQYLLFKQYAPEAPLWVIPLGIEQMPKNLNYFDTVFSMGVLYHRRSPLDHLYELKSFLRPDGELVLETLVIDGKLGESLVPADRYAQMRNVWFIPTTLTLESWLKRCGYKNIRLIDITQTTSEEQRKTEWMNFLSLDDFLDKNDKDKTIEGYPAPKRAIFTAEKK